MANEGQETRKRNLNRLADAMVARHLRISIPDGTVRNILAATQSGNDYPVERIARKSRCIAIVGAGASAPLRERADDLATMLEDTYGRDDAEIERLTLVGNATPNDFEIRLAALSRTPDAERKVRSTIAERYNVRHPPVLAYELLAHLLKHRFIDGVITFNFDELLDRSLDDELDAGEYRRIVSERDCNVVDDPDAADYVPLYIKLHGTASDPETLRFAPDSYYWLPPRMIRLVRELMHTEECVLLNVGAGLGSFDFQRFLGIPDRLALYNLSVTAVSKHVRKKINEERMKPKLAPAPLVPKSVIGIRTHDKPWLFECSAGEPTCDEQMASLVRALKRGSRKLRIDAAPGSAPVAELVPFRSVKRHETIAGLLGPESFNTPAAMVEDWLTHTELEYLKRRVILELAFAGAKARGLLSLAPLTTDRPAMYYERYRRLCDGQGDDWPTFGSAAGLGPTESIPDVLVSSLSLRTNQRSPKGSKRKRHRYESQRLHEFDPGRLARHIGHQVMNPITNGQLADLESTLSELQTESDIELHIQDDRVCSKAFRSPVILRTATSMKVYTWLMLRNLTKTDRLYICSETGGWLLKDRMVEILNKPDRVRLLVAFDSDTKKLRKAYRDANLKLRKVNPWHHNRHMTIVFNGDQPSRAIYFARHLRSPVVTAVYLHSVRDVQHLVQVFNARWKEAK